MSTSPYTTTFKWTKGSSDSPNKALPAGLKISPSGVLSGTLEQEGRTWRGFGHSTGDPNGDHS